MMESAIAVVISVAGSGLCEPDESEGEADKLGDEGLWDEEDGVGEEGPGAGVEVR